MLKCGEGNSNLSWHADRKETMVAFGTNPIINLINENNFIGWPTFQEYGGFDVQTKLIRTKDTHPNAQGHKLIADFIYENI